MRVFSLSLFYPACQNVWDRILRIEIPAQLFVDSCKKPRFCWHPSTFEVIEVLQSQSSYPFIELLGFGDIFFNEFPSPRIIQTVMILGVSKVPKDILGILSCNFVRNKICQTQVFDQILSIWLLLFLFDNLYLHRFILLILSVLQLEGILLTRKHIARNRNTILNRMPYMQGQGSPCFQIKGISRQHQIIAFGMSEGLAIFLQLFYH